MQDCLLARQSWTWLRRRPRASSGLRPIASRSSGYLDCILRLPTGRPGLVSAGVIFIGVGSRYDQRKCHPSRPMLMRANIQVSTGNTLHSCPTGHRYSNRHRIISRGRHRSFTGLNHQLRVNSVGFNLQMPDWIIVEYIESPPFRQCISPHCTPIPPEKTGVNIALVRNRRHDPSQCYRRTKRCLLIRT